MINVTLNAEWSNLQNPPKYNQTVKPNLPEWNGYSGKITGYQLANDGDGNHILMVIVYFDSLPKWRIGGIREEDHYIRFCGWEIDY